MPLEGLPGRLDVAEKDPTEVAEIHEAERQLRTPSENPVAPAFGAHQRNRLPLGP